MKDFILYGDCLDKLKTFPTNYFDAVVTDPPYGLGKEPDPAKVMKAWSNGEAYRPRGAGFMGKEWDAFVPGPEVWREIYRVLKPGGHVLSFFGTRTYDWGTMAMRFAGFEIRDQLQWIYGSGFPKSHDISKAIDKAAGAEREVIGRANRAYADNPQSGGLHNGSKPVIFDRETKNENLITAPSTEDAKRWQGWGTALKPASEIVCMARKPLTDANLLDNLARECLSLLFASIARKYLASSRKGFGEASNIARWLAGESTLTQEDLSDLMATLQSESEKNSSLNIELSWLSTLDEISKHASTFTIETASSLTTDLKILKSCLLKNTQASTLQSDGPGEQSSASLVGSLLSALALKLNFILEHSAKDLATSQDEERALRLNPNSNPIVLARKPLEKGLTVAENVLKWGTGGLNIDATRIEAARGNAIDNFVSGSKSIMPNSSQGRWPANVLLDEEAAAVLDAQSGLLKSGKLTPNHKIKARINVSKGAEKERHREREFGGDSGGASRFFYVAKASKSERNAGLEDFEAKASGVKNASGRGFSESDPYKQVLNQNFHPTVKPLKLMEYLITQVTPPGGIVLDPFAGSGTTLVAAKKLGFHYVGIEREKEYCEIAEARIRHV